MEVVISGKNSNKKIRSLIRDSFDYVKRTGELPPTSITEFYEVNLPGITYKLPRYYIDIFQHFLRYKENVEKDVGKNILRKIEELGLLEDKRRLYPTHKASYLLALFSDVSPIVGVSIKDDLTPMLIFKLNNKKYIYFRKNVIEVIWEALKDVDYMSDFDLREEFINRGFRNESYSYIFNKLDDYHVVEFDGRNISLTPFGYLLGVIIKNLR